MLSAGAVSFNTILSQAVSRADLPTPSATSELSIADWNGFINKSFLEYYKLVTTLYEYYYLNPQPYPTITTDGINSQYALPANLFKLVGVNQLLTTAPTGRIALKQFDIIADRTKWQYPGIARGAYPIMRYAQFGTPPKLWLVPEPPNGGVVLEILYTPKPPFFSNTGTITVLGATVGNRINVTVQFTVGPNVVAGNTIVIGATTYTATNSTTPSSTQFTVGSTDAGTAANLSTQINGNTSAAANITATQPDTTLPVLLLTFNFIGISGGNTGTQFNANSGDNTTATNIATVMTTQGGLSLTATASTNVITATFDAAASISGQSVTWNATRSFALFPSPTWANAFDFLNGDEEYVILDSTIKAMTKQQLDPSPFVGALALQTERIQSMDANRDEGQSPVVSDTRALGGGWDGGGTMGGGFGYWGR